MNRLSYAEATRFIYSLTNYEKTVDYKYKNAFKLDRVVWLLDQVGNPHHDLQAVHIAGTKGKGSTAWMTANVLREAGFKVGLYTSPHLVSFRERIRVDGARIPEKQFAGLLSEIRPYITPPEEGRCSHSFFDVLTVMAFLYFSRQKVDIAVVEVGMGGRLDATNVLCPLVAAITPISFDHTKHLGNDLASIAAEKAGIIKPGVPVVVSPQSVEALEVIRHTCRARRARLIQVGEDIQWTPKPCPGPRPVQGEGTCLDVRTTRRGYVGLWLPLLGDHQRINATTAVGIAEELRRSSVRIPEEAIRKGLARTKVLGRISVIQRRPTVVLDVAHNPASIRTLREVLQNRFRFKRLFLVFTLHKDKDVEGIVREMTPWMESKLKQGGLFLPVIDTPRIMPTTRIRETFAALGVEGTETSSVAEALSEALALADEEDLICVVGSFMLAEKAIEYFGIEVE